MACRSTTAPVLLLLLCSLLAVAHCRPIEVGQPGTAASSSAVAVPTEETPNWLSSPAAVSTDEVDAAAGQEPGLLLPSDAVAEPDPDRGVVFVYNHDAVVAEPDPDHSLDDAAAVAEPDPDHGVDVYNLPAAVAEPDPDEALTTATELDASHHHQEHSKLAEHHHHRHQNHRSHSHHDEGKEERTIRKKHLQRHDDGGDDSDSDSDDEDEDGLEEKAKRWTKAVMHRWFGHHHHHKRHGHGHGHRHAEEEAAKQEKGGVMVWIKRLLNRF